MGQDEHIASQMKGRGLSTYVQFVWIKRHKHIEYPVAHAVRAVSRRQNI